MRGIPNAMIESHGVLKKLLALFLETEGRELMSFSVDWQSVLVPRIGIAEVAVRGSIMYLCMLAILRFVGRRQTGHFGPADLLVIAMTADAAQNCLGRL